ncbi:MAG TPA: chemotaxis response regulator protein-glutamate methylesterase [Povalibacter sp.]|nr:chemotaxis response regulator protein-glutamate methylesterase [Povalibacter sp.]
MALPGTTGSDAGVRVRSRIEVMIVDDSAVVRQVLSEVLRADPGIEVICAVADPLLAIERMKIRWPQVIVLDVEMPRMDGLTFLRRIMTERPTPVVICSTLTQSGAATTLEALAAGAVSIVTKPKLGTRRFIEDSSGDLISVVKAASQANVRRLAARAQSNATPPAIQPKLSVDAILPTTETRAMQQTTERVVAIGTSTGGTQALEEVLVRMPRGCAGIAVVQHMPEKFTAAFAERLNRICEIEVREAAHGERLLPGHALIAPGGRHMALRRSGAYYYIDVIDGPLVNRHRPSVDVLFRSTARCAGPNALGIIMTGMGDDGARGLKDMREAGSFTIAQDEASCVVFGMPKEAIRLGGAQRVMSLSDVPTAMVEWGNGALKRAEAG